MRDDSTRSVTVELSDEEVDALRNIGRSRIEETHGNRLQPNPPWVEDLKECVDPEEVVVLLLQDAIREEMSDE